MSVQTVTNRWIEVGLTQLGIKPILNNAFETLTTAGPGYCNENKDHATSLPVKTNQIILEQVPYGPTNCNQYATLVKPGVNPLTLRGTSNTGVIYPVNDTDVCLQSCDYIDFAGNPIRGFCSDANGLFKCIPGRSTTFCGVGSNCKNNAIGGLADWMGRPTSGPNSGTWGSAINNQLSAGTHNTCKPEDPLCTYKSGYENPITIKSKDLMKNGFVTQGCECQDGTKRIAGGTFYDWAQLGAGTGPFTLNKDSGISSEVWNGEGNCDTWANYDPQTQYSTCSMNIQKYAQTCAWCKSAVLSIPGVQPDQKYPPEVTTSDANAVGVGTTTTSSKFCTFSPDLSGKYTIDNGDCLGYGANGKPRIPCDHPAIQELNCPITDPSSQKIGLFCNVPAVNRLTGQSCAFVQPQDLQFMTKGTGSNMNNYWISYHNGSFVVSINGSIPPSSPRLMPGVAESQTLTGGTEIAIVFPDGTTAGDLLNFLNNQPGLTSIMTITLSPGYVGNTNTLPSLSHPQTSKPSPISNSFNKGIFDKTTSIQLINYIYRDSSNGGTGSWWDGPIQINYSDGNENVTFSGWNGKGTNVVNITFPNGTMASDLSSYLNKTFSAQTTQAKNLYTYVIGDGPQAAGYDKLYYGLAQGQDSGSGTKGAILDPGNCNVHLDGSIFKGTWSSGAVYTDPTSGVEEPWIGMQGIACDTPPNQGSCAPMFYDPNATGDCQICDSELWKWIPGGVDAASDPGNILHNLAINTYIPKHQNLQKTTVCQQDIKNGEVLGSSEYNVSYCGTSPHNSCDRICSQNCVEMSWNDAGSTTQSTLITIPSTGKTLVDNLVSYTGGINTNISSASETCPDVLCERNPVLTLRGTSTKENTQLVTNWLNGEFDLTTLHGITTGIENPKIQDPRFFELPNEQKVRTIKAMRCCLGVDPGFQSSDGGANGGPKTEADPDPFGGKEIWNLSDCPPGVMCPSSDTCKNLYKSVLDGSNKNVTMNLNDFGSASYPTGFSLDGSATTKVSQDILLNPAYYVKTYCEMMSGGAAKDLATTMGLDDDINTLCRKAMYNYCTSPVTVDVIQTGDYWKSSGATTPPKANSSYSKTTYELPLKIFTQGCNMWFKNELQQVMPSDYGTRDMLIGSACQRLQVDGWYNPVGPDQSPLLQAFVNSKGQIVDTSGVTYDLSYVGSATATSGDSSIPGLLANTCNCFLLGSKCQGSAGSNCSYQYCGAGIQNEISIDFGQSATVLNPLNTPIDLTPYTSKLGSKGEPLGDSSWTKFGDPIAPSWTTGLNTKNFTCAGGNLPQGMTKGDEAGGTSNCYTGCNYVNEYDVCWNASPTNRKYSGEMLGGKTQWNCNFTDTFTNTNTCDPSKSDSYSCFGDCEHGTTKKDGTQFPSCGTQTWFDANLSLNPGENKVKENRSPGKSDIMDTPYWQNFYSGASEQVSSASIPNIGSIYNPTRSLLSSDSTCSSQSSIKPYNSQFASANQCVISQSTSLNNQGIITGTVGISQVGSCDVSGIFAGHDKYTFLTYMGAKDCTGQDTKCWDSNNFCLTNGSTASHDGIPAGENCMYCGNSSVANIDAPTKPNTCCLDPSLGGNSASYKSANSQILQDVTLGKTPVVSYFCSSGTCPNGSTDLATLQTTCGTGFTCQGSKDQKTCEGCNHCKWTPIYITGPNGTPQSTGSNHCIAVCPISPQNGWNSTPITSTNKPTSKPTSKTNKPIIPSSGVVSTAPNLSTGDIVIMVIGILLALAILANIAVVFNQRKRSTNITGSSQQFGKKMKGVKLVRRR